MSNTIYRAWQSKLKMSFIQHHEFQSLNIIWIVKVCFQPDSILAQHISQFHWCFILFCACVCEFVCVSLCFLVYVGDGILRSLTIHSVPHVFFPTTDYKDLYVGFLCTGACIYGKGKGDNSYKKQPSNPKRDYKP